MTLRFDFQKKLQNLIDQKTRLFERFGVLLFFFFYFNMRKDEKRHSESNM